MSKAIIFIIIIVNILNINVLSQEITSIRFEQSQEKIIIYYDLISSKKLSEYGVTLFCKFSHDNFWGDPLYFVSGEVGNKVKSGYDKMIIWEAFKEWETITGEIQFRIDVKELISYRGGSFLDNRDGKTYKWFGIGEQDWMAENLNFKTAGSDPMNGTMKKSMIYGRIYNWESACSSCPEGWHLPSDEEYKILEQNLAIMSKNESIKSKGNLSDNGGNKGYFSDPDGFNEISGSFFNRSGSCYRIGLGDYRPGTFFWTSTKLKNSKPIGLSTYQGEIRFLNNRTKYRYSVRCIRD